MKSEEGGGRSVAITTDSEGETKRLAESLAPLLEVGDVISLTGDLGAGKTCFVQGLAAGLGVAEAVTSPTFTIIKQYQGRLPLYHFDVYRLTGPKDLESLGHEEYFYGSGVTVVEWGDKIKESLPADCLTIEMHRSIEAPESRRLVISSSGRRSANLLRGVGGRRA